MVWHTPGVHEHECAAAARRPRPGQRTTACETALDVCTTSFSHFLPLQVKCTTFQHPPEEKVFGAPRPLDPEGAREGAPWLMLVDSHSAPCACAALSPCSCSVPLQLLTFFWHCSDWDMEATPSKPIQSARARLSCHEQAGNHPVSHLLWQSIQ